MDNNEAKKVIKTLEDMEGSKINYSKLAHKSGDNDYFDFTIFGLLSSFHLKLINGSIGINVAKLKLKEIKNETYSLKRMNANKQSYKTKKKHVLENAQALYNGLIIIVDAFGNWKFESKYLPEIDVDNDLRDDQESNLNAAHDYGYYRLIDKELEMF